MRAHLVATASAAAFLAPATPLQAQEYTGHRAIAAKDYDGAERRLVAQRRARPDQPELMLNLGAVYAKTGRAAQARDLYAEVLRRPSAAMDLPSGRVASSHELATAALASLDRPPAFAAR